MEKEIIKKKRKSIVRCRLINEIYIHQGVIHSILRIYKKKNRKKTERETLYIINVKHYLVSNERNRKKYRCSRPQILADAYGFSDRKRKGRIYI